MPVAITPKLKWRYADLEIDSRRSLCWAVGESREGAGPEPENCLVAIPLGGGGPRVVRRGSDFYSSPRLSPDGKRLAWLEWKHPHLPWDSTELFVASVSDAGELGDVRRISGGPTESVGQPEWSKDGTTLYFVSDRSGWWNLHAFDGEKVHSVLEYPAEFGLPMWVFGQSTYAPLDSGRLLAAYSENGLWKLGLVDPKTRTMEPVATTYTQIDSLRAEKNTAVFLGGSPESSMAVIRLDLGTFTTEEIYPRSSAPMADSYISRPEPFHYPTGDGDLAFALFYPPKNPDYRTTDRPPLLVTCHGGPTAAVSSALDLGIQFWTTRGFAVVDVNYRGSTGYGRAYRDRLRGQWGVRDVEDCIQAACFLVARGDVDDRRLAIRGASAGGYTALCAVTFHRFFHAATSYYGVSDVEALKKDTHKFESRYDDWLVGTDPKVYATRSPLKAAERVTCPVLFFQGTEDKVVPPSQTESMFDAVKKKGVPVAYLAFEGEQHGFRRAETLKRCLEAELAFYGKIMGFSPADNLPNLVIENL